VRKKLTADEQREIREVLKANGFAPCTHPDCDLKRPQCASNHIYLQAREAATTVYRIAAARFGQTIRPASAEKEQG
jgi:hypothetical protein